jgi:hypothetical protein
MNLSEKAWQGQVLQLAALYRWSHFHPYDMRRSDEGWPDLVLVRVPELVVVELKTDTGRLTAAQNEWLRRLAECGLETHVWRPRDFDDVVARLSFV